MFFIHCYRNSKITLKNEMNFNNCYKMFIMEDVRVKIKLNKKQTKNLFKQLKMENHYGDCIIIGSVIFIVDKA